jgi:hypothetical protein
VAASQSQKPCRVGAPKPVDALFDVTDVKQVVVCDHADNQLLSGVDVLVLVNQYSRVVLAQADGKRRRPGE